MRTKKYKIQCMNLKFELRQETQLKNKIKNNLKQNPFGFHLVTIAIFYVTNQILQADSQ